MNKIVFHLMAATVIAVALNACDDGKGENRIMTMSVTQGQWGA